MIFWSRPASTCFSIAPAPVQSPLSKWRSNREMCARSNAPLIYAHRQVFVNECDPAESIGPNLIDLMKISSEIKKSGFAQFLSSIKPRSKRGRAGWRIISLNSIFGINSQHVHRNKCPFRLLTTDVKTEETIILSITGETIWMQSFQDIKYRDIGIHRPTRLSPHLAGAQTLVFIGIARRW